jgi:hypothetical protein
MGYFSPRKSKATQREFKFFLSVLWELCGEFPIFDYGFAGSGVRVE